MKISDLILALQKELEKNGDVNVIICFDDYIAEISDVRITNGDYDVEDGLLGLFAYS